MAHKASNTERRLSKRTLRIRIMLASVLNEPVRDRVLTLLDSMDQRRIIVASFFQYRRVRSTRCFTASKSPW